MTAPRTASTVRILLPIQPSLTAVAHALLRAAPLGNDRRHDSQSGPATWLTVFAANGRRPFPARPSYANAPRRQGRLRHDQQNHALDGSGAFAKNSLLTKGKGRSERPIQRSLRLKVAAMSPVISVSDLPVTSPPPAHPLWPSLPDTAPHPAPAPAATQTLRSPAAACGSRCRDTHPGNAAGRFPGYIG